MPNCFQLTKKGENQPTSLVKVDNDMCDHFNEKPHSEKYYYFWYDLIGFPLAMGRTLPELIAEWQKKVDEGYDIDYSKKLLAIAQYLDTTYTVNAFAQIGK